MSLFCMDGYGYRRPFPQHAAKWTHGLILDPHWSPVLCTITRTPLHLDRIYLASLHLPITSWKGAWMCLAGVPCTRSLQVPHQSVWQPIRRSGYLGHLDHKDEPPTAVVNPAARLSSLSLFYIDTPAEQAWIPPIYQSPPTYLEYATCMIPMVIHTYRQTDTRAPISRPSRRPTIHSDYCTAQPLLHKHTAGHTDSHPAVHPSIQYAHPRTKVEVFPSHATGAHTTVGPHLPHNL